MSEKPDVQQGFDELMLSPSVLKVLGDVGYETPTPINTRDEVAWGSPGCLAGLSAVGRGG